jgi:flagellar basal body-associated protein FliL
MEEIITIILAVIIIIIAGTILFLIIKSRKSHEPLPSNKEELVHGRPPILGNLQEDLPNLSGDYQRRHTYDLEMIYLASSDMEEKVKSNGRLFAGTQT